ncbi:MAG: hypothetical protein ACRCWR_11560 [Saezia sp.]
MNQHHWQDARLKKALEHAPDCDLKPAPQVRNRILHAAAHAVQPPETQTHTASWKQKLAQIFSLQSRMPWNAAWGTALIVVCVGLVWVYYTPDHLSETTFETSSVGYSASDSAPILPQDAQTVKPQRTALPSTPKPAQAQPPVTIEIAQPASAPVAAPAPQPRPAQAAPHPLPEASLGGILAIDAPPDQITPIAATQPVESSSTRMGEETLPPPSSPSPTAQGNTENDHFSVSSVQTYDSSGAVLAGDLTMPAEDNRHSTAASATMQLESTNHFGATVDRKALSLSDAFSFALQNWDTLHVTTFNQSYSLARSQAAPLPEILPRVTNTPSTTPYLLIQLRLDSWTLVFYDKDRAELGTLIIQGNSWYFCNPHQTSLMLTGDLSKNQRQHLDEVLKTHSPH